MDFKWLRIKPAYCHSYIAQSLSTIELFTINSNNKPVMWCVGDKTKMGPGACFDITKMSATSISEDDYKLLCVLMEDFRSDPMSYVGKEVLEEQQWKDKAMNLALKVDGFTEEATQAILEHGADAEIKFRDIHGDLHKAKIAYVIPWTERPELMQSRDPEYWIRASSGSDGFLSRDNSIRVPFSEYKRVTDIVSRFKSGELAKGVTS